MANERCKLDMEYERKRKIKFKEECEAFCKKQSIKSIEEDTLKRCFEIPKEGVKVISYFYNTCYYPLIKRDIFDELANERIGKYCANNGIVVFVHTDGRTYVTKGYDIIAKLIEAGYKEKYLFVPFSNGEEIKDKNLRKIWKELM